MTIRALTRSPLLYTFGVAFIFGAGVGWGIGSQSVVETPEQPLSTRQGNERTTDEERELKRLRDEVAMLRTQLSALPSPLPTAPGASSDPETSVAKNSQSGRAFLIERQLQGVRRLIALSEGESSLLQETLRDHPQQPLREALTQVLGAERAAQYQQAKEQLTLETQQEEDQAELFALSRKLQLTAEQERSVQGVIASLRKELAPLQSRIESFGERATLLHSAPRSEETQSDLRNLYEEMKTVIQQVNEAKRSAMRERLQSVLSDEQLNQLILLQEKERNQFFEGE